MTPEERAYAVIVEFYREPNGHSVHKSIQPLIEAAIREAVAERTEAAAKVVQKAPNEQTWVCPEDAPAFSVLIPPSQADLATLIRAMKEAE